MAANQEGHRQQSGGMGHGSPVRAKVGRQVREQMGRNSGRHGVAARHFSHCPPPRSIQSCSEAGTGERPGGQSAQAERKGRGSEPLPGHLPVCLARLGLHCQAQVHRHACLPLHCLLPPSLSAQPPPAPSPLPQPSPSPSLPAHPHCPVKARLRPHTLSWPCSEGHRHHAATEG